jgi:hypothetical protein
MDDVKQYSPIDSARTSSASPDQVASFRNVPRLPRNSQMSNIITDSRLHQRMSSKGMIIKESQIEIFKERPESGFNKVIREKMKIT